MFKNGVSVSGQCLVSGVSVKKISFLLKVEQRMPGVARFNRVANIFE